MNPEFPGEEHNSSTVSLEAEPGRWSGTSRMTLMSRKIRIGLLYMLGENVGEPGIPFSFGDGELTSPLVQELPGREGGGALGGPSRQGDRRHRVSRCRRRVRRGGRAPSTTGRG